MYEDINPIITRNGNIWNVQEDIAKFNKQQEQEEREPDKNKEMVFDNQGKLIELIPASTSTASNSTSNNTNYHNNNNNDVKILYDLTKVITGGLGSKDLLYDSVDPKDNPS